MRCQICGKEAKCYFQTKRVCRECYIREKLKNNPIILKVRLTKFNH